MDDNFIAFMGHMPLADYDYLESTLLEYDIGGYLIGAETSKSGVEHYHFLVEMTTDDYHLFAERVFRKKYKLRGRATKGQARQYGKLKEIRDFERLKSYTLKEGNIRTNMSDEELASAKENSFSKNEKIDNREKMVNALKNDSIPNMRLQAIKILAEIGNNYRPTKCAVDGLVIEFCSRKGKFDKVYDILFPWK